MSLQIEKLENLEELKIERIKEIENLEIEKLEELKTRIEIENLEGIAIENLKGIEIEKERIPNLTNNLSIIPKELLLPYFLRYTSLLIKTSKRTKSI